MIFALTVGFAIVGVSCGAAYDTVFAKLLPNTANARSHTDGVAVSPNGNAVSVGYTYGLVGQESFGGSDFLLQMHTPAGSLVWTKVMGTSSTDVLSKVAVDSSSNVFVAGFTSGNFDGHPNAGILDCVVVKLDSLGNKLFSVQFGGSDYDEVKDIAVDDIRGVLYVAGKTQSPVLNGVTRVYLEEYFITTLNSTTGAVLSHFHIPYEDVHIESVSVDSAGYLWTSGWTTASTYYGTSLTGYETFAQKFDSSGNSLKIAWLEGTSTSDMAADASDNKFLTGDVNNSSFYGNPSAGGQDIYVAKFDSTGGREWVKTYGGTDNEYSTAIAVDSSSRRVYVTGQTDSTSFYGTPNPTGTNAFLLVLSAVDGSVLHTALYPSDSTSVGDGIATNGLHTYFVGTALSNFQGQAYTGRKGFGDGFIVGITTPFATSAPTTRPSSAAIAPPHVPDHRGHRLRRRTADVPLVPPLLPQRGPQL